MPKTQKQTIGEIGENIVVHYAKQRGWKVLARNYRKPWGEIDIVARDGAAVLFIEVKAQEFPVPENFKPEDHFNYKKEHTLTKALQSYLLENRYTDDTEYRVDLAAVEVDTLTKVGHVRYYSNVL